MNEGLSLAMGAVIVLLARLGRFHVWPRRVMEGILALLGLMLAGVSGRLLLGHPTWSQGLTPAVVRWWTLGYGMLALGIWGALVGVWWLRRRGRRVTVSGVELTDPLTLAGWALFLMAIGSNVLMRPFVSPEDLRLGNAVVFVLAQEGFFLVYALIGLGLGLDRTWPEVRSRLGLDGWRWRDVWAGLGGTVVMLIASTLMAAGLGLFFSDAVEEAAVFNRVVVSQLPGVMGVVIMGAATGIGEEVLFRGAIQPLLGVWVTSLLFAGIHLQYFSPVIVVAFMLGVILGWMRLRWGLMASIWAHSMYNTLVGLLALLALQSL